jgi:hypothetical protein
MVRDLYDLHRFAATPFDGELLRRRAILKLWQVRDPFDPKVFFARLRSSECLEPEDLLRSVETRFAVLRNRTELELAVIDDARSGWNEPLAERLRTEIRALHGATLR